MNQNESKWIKMDQNGSKWIKMDQNESKWIKMDQNGSNLIKLDFSPRLGCMERASRVRASLCSNMSFKPTLLFMMAFKHLIHSCWTLFHLLSLKQRNMVFYLYTYMVIVDKYGDKFGT